MRAPVRYFGLGAWQEWQRPERASAGFSSQWLVYAFAGSVTSSAMFNPIPGRDPNEAYDVIPSPARLRMPAGWLTVTCNGIPVRHFGPASKHLAGRYATDPEYRQSRAIRKVHEDAGRQ